MSWTAQVPLIFELSQCEVSWVKWVSSSPADSVSVPLGQMCWSLEKIEMSDYFLLSMTEHWATVPQKHSFILGRLTFVINVCNSHCPAQKKGSFPSQRRTIAKIIYVCRHRGSESSYGHITSFTQHADDGVPTKRYHFYLFTLVFNISYDFPPVE